MRLTATKAECAALARTCFGADVSVCIERNRGTWWTASLRDFGRGVTKAWHWIFTTSGLHDSPARAYGELRAYLGGRAPEGRGHHGA